MRKNRFIIVSLAIGLMLFSIGCVPMKPRVTYNPSNPIKSIAVLPVLNHTNDVDAPEKFRDVFEKELVYMGYRSKPLPEVNRILKDELGITLGKQLDMTNPVELGQKLGVDALIYGALYDFDEKTTGVLDVRRVKGGFKMVVARDLTSENLSPFANLKEAMDKSWLEVLKTTIDTIDAEEKAGRLKKDEAEKARDELKKAYNIKTLDLAKLTPPTTTKWGSAGTTFWAAGAAVKGTTKANGGGGIGLVASGAAALSKMSDLGDLKNAKEMSEYPGIEKWIDLPQEQRQVESGLGGLGKSFATSLATKTLGKTFGVFLKAESDRVIREITRTVPVGPGDGGAMPVAPVISVAIPEVKAPAPPSFGYMDYGKKDFSALMISTSVNKTKNDSHSFEAPIFKAGEKFRMEVDMSKMAKGGEMPQALSKMVNIHRGDKKLSHTLYTNKQKYITTKDQEGGHFGEEPKIEKTKIGSETIDKHPTDKYKVKITYKDGEVQEGFIWNARDLDGMTIKSEVENKDYKITTELKNVVPKTPAAALFEIPNGYTEAKGFMELMSEK